MSSQEKTQCKCMEVSHRIFSATLSPTLDLSTWISLLDPPFAVAHVTLVNYSMLGHPNGWIINDPRNRNPQTPFCAPGQRSSAEFQFHEQVDRFEWSDGKDWRSQQSSFLSADPLTTHSILSVFQFQHSWSLLAAIQGQPSSPDAFRGHLLQSTGHSKRLSEDIPWPTSIPLHDPQSYTLSWAPALQKASGLFTAPMWNIPTSCTCGFLFYLFLSCGRYVECDPRARWPGWTWCRMFIHMHWNSLHVHIQNCCNQEMSHEMCKRRHINNLFYSLN